jgi:hypothetical protein
VQTPLFSKKEKLKISKRKFSETEKEKIARKNF